MQQTISSCIEQLVSKIAIASPMPEYTSLNSSIVPLPTLLLPGKLAARTD